MAHRAFGIITILFSAACGINALNFEPKINFYCSSKIQKTTENSRSAGKLGYTLAFIIFNLPEAYNYFKSAKMLPIKLYRFILQTCKNEFILIHIAFIESQAFTVVGKCRKGDHGMQITIKRKIRFLIGSCHANYPGKLFVFSLQKESLFCHVSMDGAIGIGYILKIDLEGLFIYSILRIGCLFYDLAALFIKRIISEIFQLLLQSLPKFFR